MARPKKIGTELRRVDGYEKVTGYDAIKTDTNALIAQFNRMRPQSQIEFLKRIGVGIQDFTVPTFATCQKCGQVKKRSDFYESGEFGVASGITPICKACTREVANGVGKDAELLDSRKSDLINAMEWIRKPFLESIYSQACTAATGETGKTVYDHYIMIITRKNYSGQTFRSNSDFYNANKPEIIERAASDMSDVAQMTEDAALAFEKNKLDCQRLLGYLPFDSEEPVDQPYLYADLIGFLGSIEDVTENYMRVRSMVGIVRWFLQIEKIDNAIARMSSSAASMDMNMASIRGLQETKQKITDTITKMADDSRISLKSNHDNVRGSNTFTGKLSKLKDLNLRASYVNGFDIETCKAMQQVADISSAAILKQLNLDESEWSDMVAEQRKMITALTNQTHSYQEAARILLKENQDLRQTLTDNGLLRKDQLVDLSDIVNTYWVEGDKNGTDSESNNL